MTVNITVSETAGGFSMPDTHDGGELTPGNESAETIDLYISHDAQVNAITDCAFYIQRAASSNYLGDDADADILEVFGWGDNDEGFRINQEHQNSFPSGSWDSFKSSSGDIDNQIQLIKESLSTGSSIEDGKIPVSAEAHVKLKWVIPSDASGAGYRGVSLVFAYSATS